MTVARNVLAWLLLASGCGGAARTLPLPPAWPVSGPGDLAAEVQATADAPEAPTTPGDVPGVQAREGHAHGLRYFEVVLGDVDFDAPLPLVMMIHGRGDRPRVPGGPFAGVPTPLRIILPEGPDPLGVGFMWLPVRVGEGKTDVLSEALIARAAQLAALLDEVRATRPTIGTPIVTGFSQGGVLSFAMAIRHPDVVGAAMPLAGWLPPPLWPDRIDDAHRALRIRSMHGTADRIIEIAPTIDAVAHLRQLGIDVELEPFEGVGHEMTPEMNALFEAWLEAALSERAGALDGGPGAPGPEVPDDAVPWEEQPADGADPPLEPEATEGEDLETDHSAPDSSAARAASASSAASDPGPARRPRARRVRASTRGRGAATTPAGSSGGSTPSGTTLGSGLGSASGAARTVASAAPDTTGSGGTASGVRCQTTRATGVSIATRPPRSSRALRRPRSSTGRSRRSAGCSFMARVGAPPVPASGWLSSAHRVTARGRIAPARLSEGEECPRRHGRAGGGRDERRILPARRMTSTAASYTL